MAELSVAAERPPAARALPARMAGVVWSPSLTFRGVAASPTWFGVLVVVTLLSAGLWFWFAGTEAGQLALLDQQERQAEAFGGAMSNEQRAQVERMLPVMRFVIGGTQLVLIPLFTFIIAGILFGVFTAGMGGSGSFRQVLAVVSHSATITLLAQVFAVPLNYVRESMSSPTNLGVFVPFLDEASLPARFLGIIDVFLVWWIAVLAIGLGVLYGRRTGPIFWSLLGVYLVIALVIAVVMRVAAGS
jgi:hypothetical protein